MTLGIFFIIILVVLGVGSFVNGMCEDLEGRIVGGVLLLIVAGLSIIGRSETLDNLSLKEDCISSGRNSIEILNKKVCVISN
jgi:hypothetical protein